MPKPSKTKPKQKAKPKLKHKEPEVSSITTKKSYWITLVALLAVVTVVFGFVMNLGLAQTAILVVTVAVLIGFIGFFRTSPSTVAVGKRATFIFMGVSVIGFGIWAAITLTANATGLIGVVNSVGELFFAVTSLVICLTAGAFIGELIGRNKTVQERLFPPKMD